jgi:transcriptional regulator GlxA family with amidase domain
MGGLSIAETRKFSEYAGPIDTLIVVGGIGSVEDQSPKVLEWLRKRASRIRRVASVGHDGQTSAKCVPERKRQGACG